MCRSPCVVGSGVAWEWASEYEMNGIMYLSIYLDRFFFLSSGVGVLGGVKWVWRAFLSPAMQTDLSSCDAKSLVCKDKDTPFLLKAPSVAHLIPFDNNHSSFLR